MQLYGYRIENLPKVKPDNMPEEVYDELKKKYLYKSGMKPRSKSPNSAGQAKLAQSRIKSNSKSVIRIKKQDSSLSLQFSNSLDVTKKTFNESTMNAYLNP